MNTQLLINKATAELTKHAKEPLKVEVINGFIYVWGSELACLRLFKIYHLAKNVQVKYSENGNSWYFSMESFLIGVSHD